MDESKKGGLFSDRLLDQIRERFWFVESDPQCGERVWFESASGSLRLKASTEALALQTRFPDQLGRANLASHRAGEVLTRGTEDVKLFLGARSGTIAPAMSSTHAVFRIVDAMLAAKTGKNVLTTELEHPCVYDSTRQLSARYGLEWRVAPLNPATGGVTAETILDRVDPNTALIGLIHGANITGSVIDVGTVVREARTLNPDVFVLVDGVQYAPHAPVDVETLGVDAYVFGPYKAFGPKGIGFAYLSERASHLEHSRLSGNPVTNWALGSPEEANYGAWSAVVEYLCWLGGHFTDSGDRRNRVIEAMKASKAHLQVLLSRLLHGTGSRRGLLEMEHVQLHGFDAASSDRLCLVLMSLRGMDSYQGVEYYSRAGIRVHNRTRDAYSRHVLDALGITEGIRVSCCHYNSPADIDRLLEVTETAAEIGTRERSELRQGLRVRGPGEG